MTPPVKSPSSERGLRAPDAHWTAKRIKALREKLGLTQTEFADKVGATGGAATVSRWENGHYNPSAAACQKLEELSKQADAAD